MHEFAIVDNILKSAEESAREHLVKEVSQVCIVIGEMRQVVPDILIFAFDVAKKDTSLQNAELKIENRNLIVECSNCNKRSTLKDLIFICPFCGSHQITILQGKELFIKSITGS